MKPLLVYVPQKMHLRTLRDMYSKKLDINYLLYIIYYILYKMSFNFGKKIKRFIDVPICALKLIVSHQTHSKHIDFLTLNLSTSPLLHRKNYSEGKCFSYSIDNALLGEGLKIDYIENPIMIRKIIDVLSVKDEVVFDEKKGKYGFMSKYFDRARLKIDIDGAILVCEERYLSHKNYIKYLKEMILLSFIYNGIYLVYYNKDTDSRIHSNITMLPKVYRGFLSYDDKQLVEVDLSNSVLYLLAMILNDNLSNSYYENISLLYMFKYASESVDITEKELFIKKCVDGSIYVYLIPFFEEFYNDSDFENFFNELSSERYTGSEKQKRKVVKKRVLAMLFAKVNSKKYRTEREVFNNVFPSLLAQVNRFKSENGHKKFSHLLFQVEANSVLNLVARRFNREYHKKAPIFSLHDCLITTVGHEEILKQTLEEELKYNLGYCPSTEVDPW